MHSSHIYSLKETGHRVNHKSDVLAAARFYSVLRKKIHTPIKIGGLLLSEGGKEA